MVRGESKYSPRRIKAIEKQRQALELRMAGRTFESIAQVLGYKTHVGAIAAVKVALQRTLQPISEEYRALTLERLTKVLQTFWPTMLQKDPEATRLVLKAIGDIRELLGLDAPKQIDISQQIVDWAAILRELNRTDAEPSSGSETSSP